MSRFSLQESKAGWVCAAKHGLPDCLWCYRERPAGNYCCETYAGLVQGKVNFCRWSERDWSAPPAEIAKARARELVNKYEEHFHKVIEKLKRH